MKHTLEQSGTFPYIAWCAVIAFGAMTVMLSIKLDEEMTVLASNRDYLEMVANEISE